MTATRAANIEGEEIVSWSRYLIQDSSDAGTSESVLTCVIHVHVGAQLLFDTNDVLGPGI